MGNDVEGYLKDVEDTIATVSWTLESYTTARYSGNRHMELQRERDLVSLVADLRSKVASLRAVIES